jgi:hypothetical protein
MLKSMPGSTLAALKAATMALKRCSGSSDSPTRSIVAGSIFKGFSLVYNNTAETGENIIGLYQAACDFWFMFMGTYLISDKAMHLRTSMR